MELISREDALKIILKHLPLQRQCYKEIEEEMLALPHVNPEQIKANVKRLYRYEKSVAAKRRDG